MIGTSPAAGTQLSTVQPVTLLISRGANTVVVPNVVGLSDQAALAALSNAGLVGHRDPEGLHGAGGQGAEPEPRRGQARQARVAG